MMSLERHIRVELGKRSYYIHIGKGILSEAGQILCSTGLTGKSLIVTNPTVGRLYLDKTVASLKEAGIVTDTVVIPDGEEYKNLTQVERVYEAAVRNKLERNSTMIALGGGVIGDLTGFAAATYLRGVKFIQIPTTLLAQVDSSVGGKVAVNYRGGKNLVGAFYQPAVVISDLETLNTLEEREFKSGLAEIIKAGLIKDTELVDILSERATEIKERKTEELIEIIYRACRVKVGVVEEDELESGVREILNYGHTIGHALEAVTGYGEFRHGEAVSIGMAGAAYIGELSGLTAQRVREFTCQLLRLYDLPTKVRNMPAGRILERMYLDKKVRDGRIRFILPVNIGHVVGRDDVSKDRVMQGLMWLGADGGRA